MVDKEAIQKAKEQRVEEVASYQTNITNYKLALDLLTKNPDPDLADFKIQLNDLLRSEIIEQKKAKLMLDVMQLQLDQLSDG